MSMEEQFKSFLDQNKENIKMALVHGNFDDAMEIIFSAGYHSGYNDKPVVTINGDVYGED